MEAIVQWATILSPIIAVVIAIWASRSSAKETAKKIAALEESTTKQVESIKKLARIQIETAQIQINKELWEARTKHSQASQKKSDMNRFGAPFVNVGEIGTVYNQRMSEERNLTYESVFLQKNVQVLEQCQRRLIELLQIIKEG